MLEVDGGGEEGSEVEEGEGRGGEEDEEEERRVEFHSLCRQGACVLLL